MRSIFKIMISISFILAIPSLSVQKAKAEKLSKQDLSALNEELKTATAGWTQSAWWLDTSFSSNQKEKLAKLSADPINVLMAPPPCPTGWRWWLGKQYDKKALEDHRTRITNTLFGFPESTIEYCKNETYAIRNGIQTKHPINRKRIYRSIGSLMIKDLATNEVKIFPIIQENDFSTSRNGGKAFNANLIEVCDIKFMPGENHIMNCGPFGLFPARLEVKQFERNDWTLFGENEKYSMFVSGLSVSEAKNRYKHLMQTTKKCSFNCK